MKLPFLSSLILYKCIECLIEALENKNFNILNTI